MAKIPIDRILITRTPCCASILVSDRAGEDPGGGKRGLRHCQIFEIVIFSNCWSIRTEAID